MCLYVFVCGCILSCVGACRRLNRLSDNTELELPVVTSHLPYIADHDSGFLCRQQVLLTTDSPLKPLVSISLCAHMYKYECVRTYSHICVCALETHIHVYKYKMFYQCRCMHILKKELFKLLLVFMCLYMFMHMYV